MTAARDEEPKLSLVTLVNDERMYAISRATLAAQHPESVLQWIPVDADAKKWNAAEGLNDGIERAEAEIVVCVHQDVLFPNGWWERARQALLRCPAPLGVVGLVGTTAGGRFAGHVLDPHGHHRWGSGVQAVSSLDEHVLILNRRSSPRFDPSIPGFHCYGTDLALQSLEERLGVYVIDAPVVHLSGGGLDPTYRDSVAVLLAKWGGRFQGIIPTPAAVIDDGRTVSWSRRLRVRYERRRSRAKRFCRCNEIQLKSSRIPD